MKIKTSELIGAALDWAVANCEKISVGNVKQPHGFIETAWDSVTKWENACEIYSPSTDWSQGGPIIEREKISPGYWGDKHRNTGIWIAHHQKGYKRIPYEGETLLIAAMRCYVASKLGDEVDIPEELVK